MKLLNARYGFQVALTTILFLVSSCGTAKINHFKDFSHAGTAYGNAIEVLLNEAGPVAIDADSVILLKTRPSLPSNELEKNILDHNKLLGERINLLRDLRQHTQLLRLYFEALASLAESDAPKTIGTSTNGLVASLQKLHPGIAKAKFGDAEVSSFMGNVTNVAVSHFQEKGLENELKMNAQTIERELDLQQAVLTALVQSMRTDLQLQLERAESTEVVLPYVSGVTLPANWRTRRREILIAQLSLVSADAATDAAKKLKNAFVALVEGRFQLVDISSFIKDINRMLTIDDTLRVKEEMVK